jgi:type IV pilus assembly protein PilW
MKMPMVLIKRTAYLQSDTAGFTLIEMMVAIVVSLLVMAAVVSIYMAQSKSHSSQDDVANIQQNLRGVLLIMEKEIRLAGCDPQQTGLPGFVETNTPKNILHFTRDIKGDPVYPNMGNGTVTDPDEDITYEFTNNQLIRMSNADGNIQHALANNIDGVEFNYIVANLGAPTDPSQTSSTLVPTNFALIRGVQVTILGRATNLSMDFTNTTQYTAPGTTTWGPFNDHYRRRMVTIMIECRNMWYPR